MKRGLIIGAIIIVAIIIVLGFYLFLSVGEPEGECEPAGRSADESSFGRYIGPKKCCEGLVKIPDLVEEDGKCFQIPDTGTICSDCGNNICEEWENQCNCPSDCK